MARGAMAGFLILVLIGFGPGSDIVAHIGGFLAGAVIGLALNAARPAVWQGGWVNVAGALALAALLIIVWRQALPNS
jgi:NaMN:DMB phosphoribosyltransferase